MKILHLLSIAAVSSVLFACGGSSSDADVGPGDEADITKDACTKAALSAAEDEYGNDPMRTHVKVLTKGKRYAVTVGIGNPEDGAHDYYVDFASGCSSKPKVTDVPWYPHPLRDAMHTEYQKLLRANGNKFPASAVTDKSTLPAAAKKQLETWVKNKTCTSVDSYEVSVGGKSTFAVACTRDNSGNVKSYDESFVVWDDKGGDIDMASVWWNDMHVGVKGISWQNETFEENF